MNLKEWLCEHTAEDVLRSASGGKVVLFTVNPTATISDCLWQFGEHRIHNLLTRSQANSQTQNENKINWCWIRLEDVIPLILNNENDTVSIENFNETVPKIPVKLIEKNDCLFKILDYWPSDSPYLSPLVILERIEESPIMGIISAADVLHYLYIYEYHLDCLMDRTTATIDFDTNIKLVKKSETVLRCLQILLEPDSPGILGIVDRKGSLQYNFTLSIFSPLATDDLEMPIMHYLTFIENVPDLVTSRETLKYGDLLGKILQTQVHHVWKLNEFGQPIGIIHLNHLLDFVRKTVIRQRRLSISEDHMIGMEKL